MKKFLSLLILVMLFTLNNNLKAQEHIQVEVSNFKFVPNNFTINVGDTITWTNVQGNHNVNGNNNFFPNNPDEFMNPVGGPGWTYTYVFTVPGDYKYHCDPHASFMMGAFTVNGASGINNPELNVFSVYPNPAKAGNTVIINGLNAAVKNYSLTDNLGREIGKSNNNSLLLPENLSAGIYYIKDKDTAIQLIVE